MKKQGIFNSKIAAVVASMGHTDLLGVVDAGFPISDLTQKIDLIVKPGLPAFLEVLENILTELYIEEVIVANELIERNPSLIKQLMNLCPNAKITQIPHEQFKSDSLQCKAIIRTGECVPFSNIMLRAGVIF